MVIMPATHVIVSTLLSLSVYVRLTTRQIGLVNFLHSLTDTCRTALAAIELGKVLYNTNSYLFRIYPYSNSCQHLLALIRPYGVCGEIVKKNVSQQM